MTEAKKKSRKKNGRLYIQPRNISLVGLRDLPDHMVTGTSKAQLTPIFSIFEKNVFEAFDAQLKGDVADYMDLIPLKKKFSSSKLEVRTDTDPSAFGWIEDMEVLRQLPEEFGLLRERLDSMLEEYAPKFLENISARLKTNTQLLSACGVGVNLSPDAQEALASLK